MISIDDYCFFVNEALDGLVRLVDELGDDRANSRPDLAGANSPYAVLVHCLGVLEYWGGHVVAGREIRRDRDTEFHARGSVTDLVERVDRARAQLRADLADCDPSAAPRGDVADPADAELPLGRTQGGALMHLYSELAQHRGQAELTRDVLLAPWAELATNAYATPQPDSRYW
jgi:hypothetical protein